MEKIRKFVTTGVGLAFVVVGTTGLMFQFLFKTKVLENIHGWIGVGLCAVAVLHVVQNWRPLRHHLRDARVFLLVIPVLAVCGFFVATAPKPAANRGPSARQIVAQLVEAPAQDVAKALGADVGAVLSAMERDGVASPAAGESLKAIAQRSGKSPEQVLGYFAK